MKVLLTGSTGGIGSAIKENLERYHEVTCIDAYEQPTEQYDWMICAHGVINEEDALETFVANTISNINLTEGVRAERIIFISSTSALKGNDRFPIYSASKAALNMYAKSVSGKREVYILCPGPTDTPLWRNLGLQGTPQSPKSVADAVSRIMNSAGMYRSGDIITVRNGEIT